MKPTGAGESTVPLYPEKDAAHPQPEHEYATFAVGGNAECVAACAARTQARPGPQAWLEAAVALAHRIGAPSFLYTGPSVTAGKVAGARGVPIPFAQELERDASIFTGAQNVHVAIAPQDREGTEALFLEKLQSFIGSSRPSCEHEECGAAYALDEQGARVIVLDESAGEVGPEQLQWLEAELQGAKSAGEPAIVVGHADLNADLATGAVWATELVRVLVTGTRAVADPCATTSGCASASAYFYDSPEEDVTKPLRIDGEQIETFGSGTLGYVNVISERYGNFHGASGILLGQVELAAREAQTNRAPVSARLIPVIGELALEARAGTLLRRSESALFDGLARRPRAGNLGEVSEGNSAQVQVDQYIPIPEECIGECATGLFPEYTFSSSDPEVGQFVEHNKAAAEEPLAVLQNAKGEAIPDEPEPGRPLSEPQSGLFCAYNAGTTTVTISAGGLSYSLPVTVQAGSVRQPCGTVPIKHQTAVSAVAAPAVPPPAPAPAPTGAAPASAPPVVPRSACPARRDARSARAPGAAAAAAVLRCRVASRHAGARVRASARADARPSDAAERHLGRDLARRDGRTRRGGGGAPPSRSPTRRSPTARPNTSPRPPTSSGSCSWPRLPGPAPCADGPAVAGAGCAWRRRRSRACTPSGGWAAAGVAPADGSGALRALRSQVDNMRVWADCEASRVPVRAAIRIHLRGHRRRSLAFVSACLLQLVLLALAGAAHAEYGTLGRFPFTAGKQPGQVNPEGPHSFAVDSSEGSFYVADEPENGEYRIQRFNVKGELQASTSFKPAEAAKVGTQEGVLGFGGMQITVDPAHHRIYALLLYARRGKSEKEEKEEAAEEKLQEKEIKEGKRTKLEVLERTPLDSEEIAAGDLYGFEYKEGAGGVKELVSMKTETGTGVTVPILGEKGANSFRDQGEGPKEALLNPRGLAVDPVTGNVVITGDQDRQENINVEKGGEKECRGAAQLVTITIKETGAKEIKASLGRRYAEKSNVLDPEQPTCGGVDALEYEGIPYSPIVTSGGRVLAEVKSEIGENIGIEGDENQVWEFPVKDEPAVTPGEELETTPSLLFTLDEEMSLVRFGAEEAAGPTMSFVPEKASTSTGKIYLAGVTRVGSGGGGAPPVALILHYGESELDKPAEAKITGWTAGGVTEAGKPEECSIPPGSSPFLLGGFRTIAGEEGVVAFDTFSKPGTPKPETEAFEFGPGGNGSKCPHATATTPAIEVGATRVSKLKAGEKATLSSEVSTADVTHVQWRFENLTTKASEPSVEVACPHEKQTGEVAECTQEENVGHVSVEHAFKTEGEFKITEVIETDDLASPKIEVTREVTIGLLPLEVEFNVPSGLVAEQAGTFEAMVVDRNETTPHLTYVWKFGDGTESSNGPTTAHTYKTPCSPCTVTLEVKDAQGARGEAKAEIVVGKSKAEEEPKTPPTTTPTTTTATTTTPTTTTPTETTPKGGVAAYIASFAGSSLPVSSSGATPVKITCPSGGSCSGTLTLQTAGAVAASHSKQAKKKVLTLASGAFSLSGGGKSVTLHLSSAARALLSRAHGVLRAKLTILSRGIDGQQNTTTTHIVTLRLVVQKPHKH